MQKSTSGAHLVCAGAETKAIHELRLFLELNFELWRVLGVQLRIMTFFWRLTPDSSVYLAFNAKLRRHSSNKVWTIIYCWKALDVYFPTPLRARQLEFCSSRKSISSAGRSDSNSISGPFVSLLQSLAQIPQFQSEFTWNHRKTHKLIVKSRNVNFT